jgi:hypothetical protein
MSGRRKIAVAFGLAIALAAVALVVLTRSDDGSIDLPDPGTERISLSDRRPHAGDDVDVTIGASIQEVDRDTVGTLERWDGEKWVEAYFLNSGLGVVVKIEPEGSYSSAGVERPPLVGSGPDRYPIPEDAEPGRYRLCVRSNHTPAQPTVSKIGCAQLEIRD